MDTPGKKFMVEKTSYALLFAGPIIILFHAIIEDTEEEGSYGFAEILPAAVIAVQVVLWIRMRYRFQQEPSESLKQSMFYTTISIIVTTLLFATSLYFFH